MLWGAGWESRPEVWAEHVQGCAHRTHLGAEPRGHLYLIGFCQQPVCKANLSPFSTVGLRWFLQESTAPPILAVTMAENNMGPAHRYYTFTELLAIAQHFKQKPEEHMIAWILRVYDQGGLALALNSQELALLGNLTSDTIFNCLCKGLQGSRKALLTWLLQAWRQYWPSILHIGMPFLSCVIMEHCILLVRLMGMLEWIYHEPASEQAPKPTPEDMPFTQNLHQHLLAQAVPHLQQSLVNLPLKDMTVLKVVMAISRLKP
ncbi:Friend virus susceptibility protein 1-like isoform X1 [Myotis myotis]|uniref:Friend virus susceptibility protein 1-like isoform X1 n=1 Tax=Myotis myotis TaxID=51298 RepID=UPI00174DBA2E|nr:Friend virus susceptibility protein 1-like isoform X1 [Myotis myotis]